MRYSLKINIKAVKKDIKIEAHSWCLDSFMSYFIEYNAKTIRVITIIMMITKSFLRYLPNKAKIRTTKVTPIETFVCLSIDTLFN